MFKFDWLSHGFDQTQPKQTRLHPLIEATSDELLKTFQIYLQKSMSRDVSLVLIKKNV